VANNTLAMMMAVMGYAPYMILGKNPHYIVLPPDIQGRFESRAYQDCGEQIEFHAT
jgi:hypothetical protein